MPSIIPLLSHFIISIEIAETKHQVAIRKTSLLTLKNIAVIRGTQDGAENINNFWAEGLPKCLYDVCTSYQTQRK